MKTKLKRPMITCQELIDSIKTHHYTINQDNIRRMEQIYELSPAVPFTNEDKAFSYSIELDTDKEGSDGIYYFTSSDIGFSVNTMHVYRELLLLADECEYSVDEKNKENAVLKLIVHNVATKEVK